MSKLAHSNQDTMDEVAARALFAHDSDLSEDEAFEILEANGIDTITWSDTLDMRYGQWMYLNLK